MIMAFGTNVPDRVYLLNIFSRLAATCIVVR